MLVSLTNWRGDRQRLCQHFTPTLPTTITRRLAQHGQSFLRGENSETRETERMNYMSAPPQRDMISCQYWHARLQTDRSSRQTSNQMMFWLNQVTRKLKCELRASGQQCASGALTWTILVQQVRQTEISACVCMSVKLGISGCVIPRCQQQGLNERFNSSCVWVCVCVCVCVCGAGLSVAVRHDSLYSGLLGFNGALGCMAVGGLFFTFTWRTHLFAIASGNTHPPTHTHTHTQTQMA